MLIETDYLVTEGNGYLERGLFILNVTHVKGGTNSSNKVLTFTYFT